jgi:8-oxo-dGTP diphosphatase
MEKGWIGGCRRRSSPINLGAHRPGGSARLGDMTNTYTYDYPRPALSCDTVVFAGPERARKVLLVRRVNEPFAGCWALPGGFVDEGERPVDAARRELAEETGLIWEDEMVPVGAFGDPGRDPRGWNVSAAYVADVGLETPVVVGGDDAAEARWWFADELPANMAFDHPQIVAAALERVGCL